MQTFCIFDVDIDMNVVLMRIVVSGSIDDMMMILVGLCTSQVTWLLCTTL